MIVGAGGTFNDKERWENYYNIFQCSIKATQDAYMPNSQRKKEYLAIYADICKENETLIKFIVQLNNRSRTKELLEATGNRPKRNGAHQYHINNSNGRYKHTIRLWHQYSRRRD